MPLREAEAAQDPPLLKQGSTLCLELRGQARPNPSLPILPPKLSLKVRSKSQGRQNRITADIPDSYAWMASAQKVSPHHRGQDSHSFFGADVHDFWRGHPLLECFSNDFLQKS